MNLLIVTQKVDQNDQLLGFFIGWLKRLAGKFENVLVICLEKGQFDLPENVRVVSLGKEQNLPKLVWLFNFYKNIFRCRSKYDAVLVHMNPVWVVWGGLVWRMLHKKIFLWYTHKAVTFKLKLAEKLTNTIFTASRESFRLKSNKVIVTGHGIDTDIFKPSTETKKEKPVLEILSVGRIAPVKNYETLIEAAKFLLDHSFSFQVGMIGEAPLEQDKEYEKKIRGKIEANGLTEHFKFIGKVDHKNLPDYYQSYDLFVHLSKTGSLDKTILEAMACGMKVLSSNDASRGFLPSELIFREDDPKDLTDKIEHVNQKDFGNQLRQYVIENHNLENLIEKISGIISK